MDAQQSIIDELRKTGYLPEELPVERPIATGVLDASKIMSYEPELDLPKEPETTLNPEDQLVQIKFPDNLSPDAAAAFLIMVNAHVFKPSGKHQKRFIANKKVVTDFIKNYESIPNLHKHPVIGPFYDALLKNKQKIKRIPISDTYADKFLNAILPDAYEHNSMVFVNGGMHLYQKINLMCYFCGDDIEDFKLSPEDKHNQEIYKQFILQYITSIQNAKTEQEQNIVLDKFMHNFVLDGHTFVTKVEQFDRIGQLKFSKPLSLPVLLDDGSHADLFQLLKGTQNYRIMCSVFMSKLNQVSNFSNLIINGDFVCSKSNVAIVLPSQINGALILTEYPFISAIIHIPDGVKLVDLSHTVKNFSDLNKLKFPQTTSQVRVARSVINNALKNSEELKQIQIFADKYPNIEIWDTKGEKSLRTELEKEQQKLSKQKKDNVKPTKPVTQKKTEIENKTKDWLTRKEIIDMLSKDKRFAGIDDLDRVIKRAIKAINIKTENKLIDKQSVPCIHIKDIENVAVSAVQIINEDIARTNKKEQKQQKTHVVKSEKKEKLKATKNEQPHTIEIEKYIPKNIWKDICNSCKDSSQLLYNVLENINLINTDYAKQQLSGSVQYIDAQGQMRVISLIDKKEGCALGQSITKNDKRRIVWTINPSEKIMVATAFFESHAETIKVAKPYKDARIYAAKGQNTDGTPVTRNLVIQNNYLKVSELLKELEIPNQKNTGLKNDIISVVPETITKPKKKVYIKPEISVRSEPAQQETEQTPEMHKIDLRVISNNNELMPKRKRYTVRNLVDVKAIEAEINAEILFLDREIKRLSIEMGKQKNDPNEQLRIANIIIKKINDKIKLIGR